MVFDILHRLNSKAHRLLMYPSDYELDGDPETESPHSCLLRKARDLYDVKLKAIASRSGIVRMASLGGELQ